MILNETNRDFRRFRRQLRGSAPLLLRHYTLLHRDSEVTVRTVSPDCHQLVFADGRVLPVADGIPAGMPSPGQDILLPEGVWRDVLQGKHLDEEKWTALSAAPACAAGPLRERMLPSIVQPWLDSVLSTLAPEPVGGVVIDPDGLLLPLLCHALRRYDRPLQQIVMLHPHTILNVQMRNKATGATRYASSHELAAHLAGLQPWHPACAEFQNPFYPASRIVRKEAEFLLGSLGGHDYGGEEAQEVHEMAYPFVFNPVLSTSAAGDPDMVADPLIQVLGEEEAVREVVRMWMATDPGSDLCLTPLLQHLHARQAYRGKWAALWGQMQSNRVRAFLDRRNSFHHDLVFRGKILYLYLPDVASPLRDVLVTGLRHQFQRFLLASREALKTPTFLLGVTGEPPATEGNRWDMEFLSQAGRRRCAVLDVTERRQAFPAGYGAGAFTPGCGIAADRDTLPRCNLFWKEGDAVTPLRPAHREPPGGWADVHEYYMATRNLLRSYD